MKPEIMRLLLVASKDSPLPMLPMEGEEGDQPTFDEVRPGRRHPLPGAFAPSAVRDGGHTLYERVRRHCAGRAVTDTRIRRTYPLSVTSSAD